jgi:hypothetical protein
MSHHDESCKKEAERVPEAEAAAGDVCSGIDDPLRRGLCKACGLPVLGLAPFCKDHEAPVP